MLVSIHHLKHIVLLVIICRTLRRYTDSPDSDWIIDIHPTDTGLALATAGSGHGFKVSLGWRSAYKVSRTYVFPFPSSSTAGSSCQS